MWKRKWPIDRQGSILRRAIIVAGHAVVTAGKNLTADSSWALLDYQLGEPPCYLQHIRTGVELAAADPESLLLFTGGPTRLDSGPQAEASGYWFAADHYAWFGHAGVRARAITEDFARDSFENLLFGICRFHEFTGEWPEHVTLVSWAFKERRFGLHREAIRWPASRFGYVGPNNPRKLEQALVSERNATIAYTEDPYSAGPRFRAKRDERNPFRRQNGYALSCPDVAPLLRWEGPELYTGLVPW